MTADTDTGAEIAADLLATVHPEPSEWPIAEETLASNAAWLEYYASRDRLDLLAEPSEDLLALTKVREEADREVESYSREYDGSLLALSASWEADARGRTLLRTRKPAEDTDSDPEPLTGTLHPDNPQWAEIQREATAQLKRLGADTKWLEAVPDREVHHDNTVVLRAVRDGDQ